MGNQNTKKSEGFFTIINNWIQQSMDEEMIALNNHNVMMKGLVNPKELKEKHRKKVYKFVEKEIEKFDGELCKFVTQLAEDDKNLYEKLNENILNFPINSDNMTEKLMKCKTLKEFEEYLPNPFTPEEIKVLSDYGRGWFDKGDFEKALSYFSYLTIADPLNPDYYLFKGITQQNLGSFRDAILSYNVVADFKPDYFLTYLLMIECLVGMNSIDGAKQYLEEILSKVPEEEYSANETYVTKINSLKELLFSKAA